MLQTWTNTALVHVISMMTTMLRDIIVWVRFVSDLTFVKATCK